MGISQSPAPHQLNHKTYLYPPCASDDDINTEKADEPTLILLATWMNASPRPISKYVECYQNTYPRASILLLTSSTADFFLNTDRRQRLDYAPAIDVIRRHVGDDAKYSVEPKRIRPMLAHAFSNGGGGQIGQLSKIYFESTGQSLPTKAVILDSLPGRARFQQGLATLSHDLPKNWTLRIPLQIILGFLLVTFYIVPQALGMQNPAELMRANLNSIDPEYLPKDVKRCYIYSEADEAIFAHDVESHAADAKARGIDVELVRFQGSAHVQHMRNDPGRYWTTVKRMWEE